MRSIAVAALASGLLLAGCGVDPDAVPPGEEPPAAVNESPASLDLEASGIIVPAQGGFERLDIPFGSSRLGTEATLQNVLGKPVAAGSTNDCGLNAVQFDGLTVQFRDDKFVGYYATAPFVPELTRAEMLADSQVAPIEDSTLGEEFIIGDPQGPSIAGLFAGAQADAPVSSLWAGENCIAR